MKTINIAMTLMKLADFAWMAGWVTWALAATLAAFTKSGIFIPIVGGTIDFSDSNIILGLAWLFVGVPLVSVAARLASIVLRFPAVMIIGWVADRNGYDAFNDKMNKLGRDDNIPLI